MSEPYRKVGRGGAGNFYAKEDIESATTQHEDLEAQKLNSPDDSSHVPSLASKVSTSTPTRTGRGGAGNFVSAADLDENDSSGQSIVSKTIDAVASTKEKVKEKLGSKSSGYGGRGGAGNWKPDAEEEKRAREEDEEQRKWKLSQQATQDVESGLSRPEGVYHRPQEKWSGE